MTNYTQNGQPYGLKSLAQELPKYGRYGDSIVAHINPQEAALLKAMGGSGTINPDTGLPEYFIKSITQPFVQAWKGVTNIPGIKQVSDAVTPVMQTIAPYLPYIAPFIPGVGPLLAAGIGAAGAGFGGKGRSGFDFKRGLMGGITAYGLGNLYAGLQAAGTAGTTSNALTSADVITGGEAVIPEATGSAVSSSGVNAATGEVGSGLAGNASGYMGADMPVSDVLGNVSGYDVGAPLGSPQSIGSEIMRGNIGNVAERGIASLKDTVGSISMPNLSSAGTEFTTNMGNAAQGLQNLSGLGTGTASEAAKAVGTKFGMGSAGAILAGSTGMAALDEQEKYLNEQKAAGSIADTEYQAGIARIEAARKRAEEAVLANPYQFARGGQIDDELGGDYSAMGMDQGNLQKGLFGMGYAEGGTPRFLSGGGDGMSDSIHATINDKQPARLADGEFVIPADVVSHLGNGSSKAGAKQLYSMMDRVRSARTGNKSQGKQINPRKYMTA